MNPMFFSVFSCSILNLELSDDGEDDTNANILYYVLFPETNLPILFLLRYSITIMRELAINYFDNFSKDISQLIMKYLKTNRPVLLVLVSNSGSAQKHQTPTKSLVK